MEANTIYMCKFCSKECKNKNSQAQHEIRCKENSDRILSHFATDYNRNRDPINHYIKAKNLGLPKPEISEETRKKISYHNRNRSKELTQSIGKKSSKTIKEKVKNGEWHTSLAKNMHYNYQGNDFHGTWELRLAMYMDDNKIKWFRCEDNFEYFYDGSIRQYTPDFYLYEHDLYIEVKGYATEKDIEKWKQFPKDRKLIVLKENDLKDLSIIE